MEHRGELEGISQILLRRETIERTEFLRLLDGDAEAEVFRAKDEAAARKLAEDDTPPPAGKPLPEA